MVSTANIIFRDYVTDGIPASGANPPAKALIREWGTSLESRLASLEAFGTINGGLIIADTINGNSAIIDGTVTNDKLAYGAALNGLANDVTFQAEHASMQLALDYARDNNLGLWIPSGFQDFSTTPVLNLVGNTSGSWPTSRHRPIVRGAGKMASVLRSNVGAQYALMLAGDNAASPAALAYTGIQDIGFHNGAANAYGLYLQSMIYTFLDRIAIFGCSIGLTIDSCWNISIKDSEFESATSYGAYIANGPGFAGSLNVSFNDCRFLNNSIHGVFALEDSANLVFVNCDFRGNGLVGNPATGAVLYETSGSLSQMGCTFINCRFEGNTGAYDVQFVNDNGSAIISHNFIGCDFMRNGSSYPTFHVACVGNNIVNFMGCSFGVNGGYSRSGGRPIVFSASGTNTFNAMGCNGIVSPDNGTMTVRF